VDDISRFWKIGENRVEVLVWVETRDWKMQVVNVIIWYMDAHRFHGNAFMDSAVKICGLHQCALGLEEVKSSRDVQGNMILSQPGGKLVNEMYIELPLRIVIETFVSTCLIRIIAVSEH
jgi:hypothetical protein